MKIIRFSNQLISKQLPGLEEVWTGNSFIFSLLIFLNYAIEIFPFLPHNDPWEEYIDFQVLSVIRTASFRLILVNKILVNFS